MSGRIAVVSRVALSLVVAVAIGSGCAGSGGNRGRAANLSGADKEQAERLYARLKSESAQHHDRQSLDLAGSLLDYYPGYSRNDEVLTMAVDAAARLGDDRHAIALTDRLLERHGDSPLVDIALLRGAEIATAGGDSLRAARYQILYYDRDPVRAQRDDGVPRASVHFETLTASQLARLVDSHPGSKLLPFLNYLRVCRLMESEKPVEARAVASAMETLAPRGRWTVEAFGRINSAVRALVLAASQMPLKVESVGVLCPLTGRYSELGNAFYEAARMAARTANAEFGRQFTLQVEDTGGDPVNSALAARRLCSEYGSMAILGEMLSDPTVSAAVVADHHGVPLVSPTATNGHIWELGGNIFQTNVTGLYETWLLARLGRDVLLKSTFGILCPDDQDGHAHADAFRTEIEKLGARVVVEASFAPQTVDFQEQIQEVLRSNPEVLFVPASVAQMMLIGPQLDYYQVGSQIMGLSNWDNAALAEETVAALEGAVFPASFPLFPARWADEFAASWNSAAYPPEATGVALRAYQSMRLLLETMATSGAKSRARLSEALRQRLAHQDFEVTGPESFGSTVRVFRNRQIVPFAAGLPGDGQQPAADPSSFSPPEEATGGAR